VLGSQLARRIVLPLLLLITALFGMLAIAGVRQAQSRVDEELDQEADRVEATLENLALPASQRAPILQAMARLIGAELELGSVSTLASSADRARYRVLTREVESSRASTALPGQHNHGPSETLRVLFARTRIDARRRDFLNPVLVAAALGLAVAALFGFAIARTIVRPVERLARGVRAYGEGAEEIDPGPRAPGELGELQTAFVEMAGTVRDSERFAALGRLSGGIAHELRNPLTAIRMAVETGGDEARAIALSEIDRLDRTLRELLDFVRPRALEKTSIPIPELLEDVAVLLRPQCEHLRVRLAVESEAGSVLVADRDKIRQALLNLVLNAAQAQPHGGVVRVRGRSGELVVEDEGPGIADDVRETLFEAFVTTRAAGIGLGLAVVKQIADEHGATIDVETNAAGTISSGTIFTLRFPTT